MIDDFLDLEGEVVAIVNPTFYETVICIGDIKSNSDGYYSKCIFANVSDGEWGIGTIDNEFISKWGDDMDFADDDYYHLMLETIFEGERDDWILDRG